jgi:hypothetical protein
MKSATLLPISALQVVLFNNALIIRTSPLWRGAILLNMRCFVKQNRAEQRTRMRYAVGVCSWAEQRRRREYIY